MLARLTHRKPVAVSPVFRIPDRIPWATPFEPNLSLPQIPSLEPGSCTLRGKISGHAQVELARSSKSIDAVAVKYADFADVEGYVLNGWENVTWRVQLPNFWDNRLDWYSVIEQTGRVNATKKTNKDGFHLQIDAMTNIFAAHGTLSTTIDGMVYRQPADGT